jgi:hypothetical protein
MNRNLIIALSCLAGAAANIALNYLFINVLRTPLYLDTVFNAAVTFSFGLVPGLITAMLTTVIQGIWHGSFPIFFLCSFAEVALIWLLNPLRRRNFGEKIPMVYAVYIFSRLMLMYIICALAVSVIGGLVDLLYHDTFGNQKTYISAEDMYKSSLVKSEISLLVKNILSRFPVNVVDRAIVIFGGFFVFLGAKKLKKFTSYQHTASAETAQD